MNQLLRVQQSVKTLSCDLSMGNGKIKGDKPDNVRRLSSASDAATKSACGRAVLCAEPEAAESEDFYDV